MTREEFLYQFDVLYNNITSNQAPGLNGYEKSVFLTKAEYETLKNHFNSKSNKQAEGFDDSIKRQIDFSTLIKSKTISPLTENQCMLDANMKEDILFILNEEVVEEEFQPNNATGETNKCIVVPLSYDEYNRIQSKPYRYPLKNQVWRLVNGDQTNSIITIIPHNNYIATEYSIRYVKRPLPIIVKDDDIWSIDSDPIEYTIGGWPRLKSITVENSEHEEIQETIVEYPPIEIPEELHDEVLQRAVELAKIALLGDLNGTLTSGTRSE